MNLMVIIILILKIQGEAMIEEIEYPLNSKINNLFEKIAQLVGKMKSSLQDISKVILTKTFNQFITGVHQLTKQLQDNNYLNRQKQNSQEERRHFAEQFERNLYIQNNRFMLHLQQKIDNQRKIDNYLKSIINFIGDSVQQYIKKDDKPKKINQPQSNICLVHGTPIIKNQGKKKFMYAWCPQFLLFYLPQFSQFHNLQNCIKDGYFHFCSPKYCQQNQEYQKHNIQKVQIKFLKDYCKQYNIREKSFNNSHQLFYHVQKQEKISILGVQINQAQNIKVSEFKFFKMLRLTMDCTYNLDHESKLQESLFKHFVAFCQSLEKNANIKIQINDSYNNFSAKYRKKIIPCLKKVNNAKIIINNINKRERPYDFKLFLKQIAQSQMENIQQLAFVNIQCFLKEIQQQNTTQMRQMEQYLNTIFKNNSIKNLKLSQCNNFCSLPIIANLQQLTLESINFVRQFVFLNQIINPNKKLKRLKISMQHHGLQITQQLFNQLQSLSVGKIQYLIFDQMSQQPSNMIFLAIQDKLKPKMAQNILKKCVNLKQLCLSNIDFEKKLVLDIPSKQLQVLKIGHNNIIWVQSLEQFKAKWKSSIKNISINDCRFITLDQLTKSKSKILKRIVTVDNHRVEDQDAVQRSKFQMPKSMIK